MLSKETTYDMPDTYRSFRGLCVWILVALLTASSIAGRLAMISMPIRLLLVITLIFTIFTGLLYLARIFGAYPRLVYPAVFIFALFVTWTVLGDKPYDVEMTRAAYVWRLESFENHSYIKNGEAHNGVDSSGLARAALWQAMLKEGIRGVNPQLLGPKLWKFWWRDLSAKDIKEGKYNYTRVVGRVVKFADYDASKSKTGDMAIIENEHVFIYLGYGQWIEASPDDNKVVKSKKLKDSKCKLLNKPATLVRWWVLAD